jgi:hypothetical protein
VGTYSWRHSCRARCHGSGYRRQGRLCHDDALDPRRRFENCGSIQLPAHRSGVRDPRVHG